MFFLRRFSLRSPSGAAISLLILGSLLSARAQNLSGEIDGVVRDSSGAVVPNAGVIVTDVEHQQVARTLATNSEGAFTAPLLNIGRYSVQVHAQGFNTVTVNVEVHEGQPATLSIALTAGTVQQIVTVTTNQITPQLESAAAGTIVTGTQVRELSLSSRNYEQLLYLQPGISGSIPGPLDRGNYSASGAISTSNFSVNGQVLNQNSYFLDGQDMINHGAEQQTGIFPSLEAIQEISLIRNTYGAQYGGAGGGVFTASTKSGTNAFHGGVYDFFRSQILNANGYFNNQVGTPRPGIRYDDFGYYLGGPLWIPGHTSRGQAKTFFFAGQQLLRQEAQSTETLTSIPTAAQRLGMFTAPVCTSYSGTTCKSSTTSITNIDPTAQAYLTDVIDKTPLPNFPNGDPQGLSVSEVGFNNETQTFVRIDRQLGEKASVFFRYIHDPFHLTVPNGFQITSNSPGVGTATIETIPSAYLGHAEITISPKMIIEGGYGYFHYLVQTNPIGYMASQNSPAIDPQLPYPSTIARVPNITVNGRAWSSAGPLSSPQHTNQIFVNITHTAGKHTIYFGGDTEIYVLGKNQGTTNAGAFTFTSNSVAFSKTTTQFDQAFAQFLLGQVSSFTQTSLDAASGNHSELYEAYIQDDYRPTPRLTLNGGVRYFLALQPRSIKFENYPQLAFSTFDPGTYSAAAAATIDSSGLICTKAPCAGGGTPNPEYNPLNGIITARTTSPYGATLFKQPYLNFAPRLGFALDMFGNAKTSLRGGFGIYFVQISNSVYQMLTTNPPAVNSTTITSTSFDDPGNGVPTISSAPVGLTTVTPYSKTPYIQSWDLDTQQQLGHGFLLDIGYFGNHAVHQLGEIDANQPLPGAYVGATSIAPGGVTASNTTILNRVRPYLGYGSINEYAPIFSADYNSLQTSLQRRFAGKSLISVNYTYSKGLSETQGDGSSPQNIYNLSAEYGPSALDRRNIFSANFVYEEPFFRDRGAAMRSLLGDWETTGIVSYGSGIYTTAASNAQDPAGIGLLASGVAASARPDQISNPNRGAPHTATEWFNAQAFANVPTGQVRPGEAPVNSILGPGYENWDLSLFKNFSLHESLNLQLRAEGFNTFNHTNFSTIATTLGNTNFGNVTAAGSARVLQLGAKLTF